MDEPSNWKNQYFRTIRADDTTVQRTLTRMDRTACKPESNRRATERYPYRPSSLVARIRQPGDGSYTCYAVQPRNLSAGGMSFLHGGFVHAGSSCVVQLITVEGSRKEVAASIVGCRYVDGNIHEVSVRFTEEIDPTDFCEDAQPIDDPPAQQEIPIPSLVDAFLEDLPKKITDIADAVAQEDSKALQSISSSLKADGTTYGFGGLADAAAAVETALAGGAGVTEVKDQVDQLVALCRQVGPSDDQLDEQREAETAEEPDESSDGPAQEAGVAQEAAS